jgi:hypothetical protein
MGTIMFLFMTIIYWVIACRFLGIYYRRWYEHDRNVNHRIHNAQDSQRRAAWNALGLASVWPYYEAGRWIMDSLIRTQTREERRQREFAEAMRIVTNYKAQQAADERRAREEFDRKLREEDE